LFPLKPPLPPGDVARVLGAVAHGIEDVLEPFCDGDAWLRRRADFYPRTDVAETDEQFEVTVELPAVRPEDVDVQLKNGELWISGKRQEEEDPKRKTYHRVERRYGEFRRIVPLPGTIDEEKIDAKFESGVLKVTVPKTEAAKAKHIEVKV
jgi:HSP20 family protein